MSIPHSNIHCEILFYFLVYRLTDVHFILRFLLLTVFGSTCTRIPVILETK